jgi:hypothetical protein
VLRSLVVDETGPGTILRDLRALLGFVRERALPVSKKNQLPPLKVLPEINARMAHPVRLGLKRPQLKSYPHIQGLYLLLRVTGLAYVGGTSTSPTLTISDEVCTSWSHLSLTEQYFALLDAWLMRGTPEAVGERVDSQGDFAQRMIGCVELFQRVPPEGVEVADQNDLTWHVRYSPGLMGLALLEMFGLMSVEHGLTQPGKGWQVRRIGRTPLGDAVFALLGTAVLRDWDKIMALEDASGEGFGALQPIFQPYIPAWRAVLSSPKWAFRDGTYVFKASLGRIWRRIALPAASSLDDLAHAILDAYSFDYDHLYAFSYQGRLGTMEAAYHPYMDDGPWASEVRVGDVPLAVGQTMTYRYDYGDNWLFDVALERVDPANGPIRSPTLLETHGDVPDQYPI